MDMLNLPASRDPPEIREVRFPVNGLSMNVARCGDGPPIVMLHGFPDHWRVWRPVMEQLGGAFTLWAPDQRGYNLTSRPELAGDYAPRHLVSDIAGLIAALGGEPVCLVGHDWGASIGFWLAMQQPHLLKCLTVLNGAHPYLLQDAVWDDAGQRAASQYVETLRSGAFEARVAGDSGAALAADWFGEDLAAGRVSQSDFEASLQAWRRPGAWPAMLNWYRAAPFDIPPPGDPAPAPEARWTRGLDYTVRVPLQVIWGGRDPVFSRVLLESLPQHAPGLEIHHLPDAGHVPQRDDPKRCADLIRDFTNRFL